MCEIIFKPTKKSYVIFCSGTFYYVFVHYSCILNNINMFATNLSANDHKGIQNITFGF
jgi:hypothetical protein